MSGKVIYLFVPSPVPGTETEIAQWIEVSVYIINQSVLWGAKFYPFAWAVALLRFLASL